MWKDKLEKTILWTLAGSFIYIVLMLLILVWYNQPVTHKLIQSGIIVFVSTAIIGAVVFASELNNKEKDGPQ